MLQTKYEKKRFNFEINKIQIVIKKKKKKLMTFLKSNLKFMKQLQVSVERRYLHRTLIVCVSVACSVSCLLCP